MRGTVLDHGRLWTLHFTQAIRNVVTAQYLNRKHRAPLSHIATIPAIHTPNMSQHIDGLFAVIAFLKVVLGQQLIFARSCITASAAL